MGIVFRQSAKNLVVVVLGAILGALVIWLSTKYIPKQELGFTRNFTNYAVTLSQLLLLGTNSTLVVYIHRYATDAKKKQLLITLSLVVPALIACLFTIVYFVLRAWILHHFLPEDAVFIDRYFLWLPIYTLLFIYMVLLEQYLGSQLRVALPAFMREIIVRMVSIALILLFGFGLISFSTLVKGTVLTYFLPVLVFFSLSTRTKDFKLSFRTGVFNKQEYREMVHFSWYHFLFSASVLMIGYMDALTLNFYTKNGFASVAVYTTAVFFISFLQMPLKAMLPASFTVLAKAFADNDMDRARDIFKRASLNILIPTIAVAVLLCCNMNNAVVIIKNGYNEIIAVFLILFIGRMVDIATGMNDQVLSIANYYKFNFYVSLLLMGVLFAMIRTLVPIYGIYGAAWSTTIVVSIFNLIKFIFVWKKLGIQPFSVNTVWTLFAGLVAFAAGYFFPHLFDQAHHVYVRTFADAVLRSTAIIIVYVAMLLWLKPSADLREFLASIKKNKRLF